MCGFFCEKVRWGFFFFWKNYGFFFFFFFFAKMCVRSLLIVFSVMNTNNLNFLNSLGCSEKNRCTWIVNFVTSLHFMYISHVIIYRKLHLWWKRSLLDTFTPGMAIIMFTMFWIWCQSHNWHPLKVRSF